MQSILKKRNVTCIIPFFNEDAHNLHKIIYTLLHVPEIERIVVVDDGSYSRETFDFLYEKFVWKYNIEMIRLEKNQGKSCAINFGLNRVFTENVLLIDADLKRVNKVQISEAIKKYDLLDLEMVILKRINSLPLVKLIRADTILSGERIINKKHLTNVLKSNVFGYQLEVAINQYFLDNKLEKKCFWSPSSAMNNYKHKKINFFKGICKDAKMYVNLIRYVGIVNFYKQVSGFCKESV
jgi:glycosyltransferase involved in cell wall biosynthesis